MDIYVSQEVPKYVVHTLLLSCTGHRNGHTRQRRKATGEGNAYRRLQGLYATSKARSSNRPRREKVESQEALLYRMPLRMPVSLRVLPGWVLHLQAGVMKIISFAWTTPALVAGRKTVTRRRWKERFALGFNAGDEVQAYDKLARNHGSRVAIIRLTKAPYLEPYSAMPDFDYEAEGFNYFEEHPGELPLDAPWPAMNWGIFESMRDPDDLDEVWVVRFELVHLT